MAPDKYNDPVFVPPSNASANMNAPDPSLFGPSLDEIGVGSNAPPTEMQLTRVPDVPKF